MQAPAIRRCVTALTALVTVAAGSPFARATTAAIGPDGNLHVDGAPFFPIGIYHVSWIGNRQGGKAVPDLHLAADQGFNLFHATIDSRDDTQDLLDAAAARGVHVIGEIPWPANGPDDFVNEWKAHPAMIGWLIADDFNAPYAGPSYNHPPAEVAARAAHLATLAPEHVSYASGGSYPGFRIQEFLGAMEVMGFQSYPLGAQNAPDEYALQENIDGFDWVADQIGASGQLWAANPQAYRWDGSRYPTPREARNLLYGALLHGAKGILWYAMWEGASRHLPSKAPDLWADLARTNAELASLTPFLLHGARTALATGNARLHAASWRLAGQLVVAVLSTERGTTHPVALALPPEATGPAHVLFPGRAEFGLTAAGGQLAGDVGPEEVHVYLLDLETAGNAPPAPSFSVAPPAVAFGESATLDASASSDPDGPVTAWEWDLGDGTLATGVTTSHSWRAPGTYFVRLTVRDDDGAPATTIVPLEVGVTSLCAPSPAAGCKTATSTLTLRDPGVAARRSLAWSWKRGATTPAELGDPTTTRELALCVYDASGLALATGVRPGEAWSGSAASGFRLRAAPSVPGGLTRGRLKPGSGSRASLTLSGKGDALPGLGLPLALPVTAQLVGSGGACWQGTYGPGPGTRSTTTLFRGKDG